VRGLCCIVFAASGNDWNSLSCLKVFISSGERAAGCFPVPPRLVVEAFIPPPLYKRCGIFDASGACAFPCFGSCVWRRARGHTASPFFHARRNHDSHLHGRGMGGTKDGFACCCRRAATRRSWSTWQTADVPLIVQLLLLYVVQLGYTNYNAPVSVKANSSPRTTILHLSLLRLLLRQLLSSW